MDKKVDWMDAMSTLKLFAVILILFAFVFPIFTFTTPASSTEDIAVSAINRAEEVIALAYQSVLEAEKAGANVSGLLTQLNVAGQLLAEARTSYRLEDFDRAVRSANLCYENGEKVRFDAQRLKDLATKDGRQLFWWTTVGSIVGVGAVIFGGFLGWQLFKRRYFQRMGTEVVSDES